MVPPTPNSELLNMMREVAERESDDGLKFKIIETGGRTIKREVQQSNPTATPGCNSGDCLACKDGRGKGGGCRRSNALYQVECNQCPTESPSVYIGETARNLYSRAREHQKNYDSGKAESFMVRHQRDEHGGTQADFNAKILCTFRDCLSRQVSEGVHIRRCKHRVLNSKAEWHQPALWRVHSELSQE